MENRNLKKTSRKLPEKIFSSNMCLVIFRALSVVKIPARLDLPSSISKKVQKEGGVPLKQSDTYFTALQTWMMSQRHDPLISAYNFVIDGV
jgi:hypothetical protein